MRKSILFLIYIASTSVVFSIVLHEQEERFYPYFYFDDTFDLPKIYRARLMSGGTLISVYILECTQSREVAYVKFKQSLLFALISVNII